jgi:hypothetical protein
MCVLYTIS